MIPTYLMPLANHLWQSTLFAVTVALLCIALRKHGASMRYWLWLAASVKFLIPLSWLIELGSRLQPVSVATGPTPVSFMIKEASQPFALAAPAPMLEAVANAPSIIPAVLFGVWLCGFAIGAGCWLRSWLRMRRALRFATPRGVETGRDLSHIRILESSLPVEP
jgi:bla regulator protein BlaR1